MPGISSSLETVAIDLLNRAGSRLTTSRVVLLEALELAGQPMTVTEIEKAAPGLAQSSIYRNLTVLEEANLVHRIINEHDFAFYELAEHVLGHHHHLRCSNCGTVLDVELGDDDEETLHKIAKSVGRKHKFTNVHHHLEFVGLCEKCS